MRQKTGQKTKHTFIPKTSLSHHPEPHLKSTSELFPSQSSPQMQLHLQVSSSQWDPSQLPGQSMGRNPSSRSRNASGELPSLFLHRCQLQLRLICGSPTWEPTTTGCYHSPTNSCVPIKASPSWKGEMLELP